MEIQLQLFGLEPLRPPASTGQPLLQYLWRPSLQRPYAAELGRGEAAAYIVRSETAIQQGDLDTAEEHLCRALQHAAAAAGAKQRGKPRPPRQGRLQHDAAFYDDECQAAKSALRRLRKASTQPASEVLCAASNDYHYLVRRKKRAWQQQQLGELLDLLRVEPRNFWQRVNVMQTSMPLQLRDPSAWEAYIQLQAAREAPPGRYLPVAPPTPHTPQPPMAELTASAAARLDTEVTPAEVSAAMVTLHNGRSAGGAAQPAEFLRYGITPRDSCRRPPTPILAEPLARLFTAVMRRGTIPQSWQTSVITPIHKSGDTADTANYRPIAVGVPLVRLYASVLNRRLMWFLEHHGLRSPAQAGFRPKMSIEHQLFALQHVVDSSRLHKRPLYACFVDLTKAYDCVQRPLLWGALYRKGVRGIMMSALKGLYTDGKIAIKVGGRVGRPQPSTVGVRQGCPLSPTLFGVFFDGLHDFLASHAPGCGVPLSAPQLTRIVSHLMYADDIALTAAAPAELQQLIDALSRYCTALGIDISAAKTQTMTFHPAHHLGTVPTFIYSGRTLPTTDSYKYLGTIFTPSGSLGHSVASTVQKTAHACHGVRAKLSQLDCKGNLFLTLHLFDAYVKSKASSSCEIWGVHPTANVAKKKLATHFRRHLKAICGLPKSVADDMLHAELERLPIEHEWLFRSLNFNNRLCQMPAGSLHSDLLRDNVWIADSDLVGGRRTPGNFTTGLRAAAAAAGAQLPRGNGDLRKADTAAVRQAIQDAQQQRWQQLDICPRTCTDAAMHCNYWRWFARANMPHRRSARTLYHSQLSPTRLRRYMRFRLSCTPLPVVQGRRNAVPRMQRHCHQCNLMLMGDQRHVVFECPKVQFVRDRYPYLFDDNPAQSMLIFMNQEDERSVVKFIIECLNELDLDT